MYKYIYLVLSLMVAPQTLAQANCFPNLTKTDMCQKAKDFVEYMSPQLPQQVNKNISWYSVAAINTSIVATYRFAYDKDYLEQTYKKNGASIAEAKEAMKKIASNICSQGKVHKAFINLGGKWVTNYTFSDGELFLRHIVDTCK
jgi:hypothetical protein